MKTFRCKIRGIQDDEIFEAESFEDATNIVNDWFKGREVISLKVISEKDIPKSPIPEPAATGREEIKITYSLARDSLNSPKSNVSSSGNKEASPDSKLADPASSAKESFLRKGLKVIFLIGCIQFVFGIIFGLDDFKKLAEKLAKIVIVYPIFALVFVAVVLACRSIQFAFKNSRS